VTLPLVTLYCHVSFFEQTRFFPASKMMSRVTCWRFEMKRRHRKSAA
jgi:hypothetical protein